MSAATCTASCRKPAGGVAAVELTPATNLDSVAYDLATGRCVGLSFRSDELLLSVPLLEDRSTFTERADENALVEHTLTLALDPDAAADLLHGSFADACRSEGVAALVRLASGRRLLAGYSDSLRGEQPLRPVSVQHQAGRTPLERPVLSAVFRSRDGQLASEIETEQERNDGGTDR